MLGGLWETRERRQSFLLGWRGDLDSEVLAGPGAEVSDGWWRSRPALSEVVRKSQETRRRFGWPEVIYIEDQC